MRNLSLSKVGGEKGIYLLETLLRGQEIFVSRKQRWKWESRTQASNIETKLVVVETSEWVSFVPHGDPDTVEESLVHANVGWMEIRVLE